MLPSSDRCFELKKSNDYLLCMLLFHAFVAMVILRSGLPLMVSLCFIGVLIFSLRQEMHCRAPMPKIISLSYHSSHWHLTDVKGNVLKYEHASVLFDGGLFFLLVLKGESARKQLIVFYDQLSEGQWRYLKWHEKTRP